MLQLLASMLPSAVSLGTSIYNKFNQPKALDTSEQQRVLNRYISNAKGDITGKTLYHTLSRPQIRQAALQREQTQRNLQNMYNRGDIGEGALAQSNVSSGAEFGRTVADISDRAMAQQIQSNLEKQNQIQNAEMNIAQLKDAEKNAQMQQNAQANQQIMSSIGGYFGQAGQSITDFIGRRADTQEQQAMSSYIKELESQGFGIEDIMNKITLKLLAGGFLR